MRKTPVLALAGVLTAASLLAGCSGSGSPGTTTTVDVTVKGTDVTPNGDKVEVPVGKQLTLHVTADKPGEIHVHSSPEQEFTYGTGTTDLHLTLDKPGVVEVESHTLDKTIVQLQAQ